MLKVEIQPRSLYYEISKNLISLSINHYIDGVYSIIRYSSKSENYFPLRNFLLERNAAPMASASHDLRSSRCHLVTSYARSWRACASASACVCVCACVAPCVCASASASAQPVWRRRVKNASDGWKKIDLKKKLLQRKTEIEKYFKLSLNSFISKTKLKWTCQDIIGKKFSVKTLVRVMKLYF